MSQHNYLLNCIFRYVFHVLLAFVLLHTSEAKAQLHFETLTLEMPTTTPADTVAKRLVYHFRNEGTAPILILKAEPGCHCTQVAYYPTDSIRPNASDSIVAIYTPRGENNVVNEAIRLDLSSATPGSVAHLVNSLTGLDSKQVIFLHLKGRVEESEEAVCEDEHPKRSHKSRKKKRHAKTA